MNGARGTALVTGSGRGIGAAIALEMARRGIAVWTTATRADSARRVAAEIERAGGRAQALELDVCDPRSVAAAAERAGPIDWLVNNAGIAESAPLLPKPGQSNDELFERQLDVNLHGARRMIEAFAPGMVERRGGALIQIVSSAGFVGYPYTAAYTASKHALLGYCRVAALELARKGVRVHAVCPHYVDSPMTDESVRRIVAKTGRTEAEARASLAAQNPGGRLVSSDEVAREVCALLDDTRGALLVELDGGPKARVRPL